MKQVLVNWNKFKSSDWQQFYPELVKKGKEHIYYIFPVENCPGHVLVLDSDTGKFLHYMFHDDLFTTEGL